MRLTNDILVVVVLHLFFPWLFPSPLLERGETGANNDFNATHLKSLKIIA